MLTVDAEDGAAGDESLDARRSDEQLGDEPPGQRDLLEVVEQEEDTLVLQPCPEALHERLAARLVQVKRLGDGRQDQLRVGDGRQGNKEYAVGEVGQDLGGGVQRQPCLAHAAGAGQSDEADVVALKQRLEGLHLVHAVYQGRGLRREVVTEGVQGARGREVRRQAVDDELDQAARAAQVLEAKLAQVT